MNQIVWEQTNVEGHLVARWLSLHNFQAGKFYILPSVDNSPYWVTIVYVKKESEMII